MNTIKDSTKKGVNYVENAINNLNKKIIYVMSTPQIKAEQEKMENNEKS